MELSIALLAGLLFGLGLIVSGMTDPLKVQGFLDLAGDWDPSLVIVMVGALLVNALAFPLVVKRPKPALSKKMHIPTLNRIDKRLIFGGLTFGVGWGLAGLCPGPALASLAHGGFKSLTFFLSLLAGMLLFEFIERINAARLTASG